MDSVAPMDEQTDTPPLLRPKVLWTTALVLLALGLAFYLFWQNEQQLLEWLQHNHDWLQERIAAHPVIGAVMYVVAFTLMIGFYIPGGILLLLLAGALFPFWEANLYAGLGNMLGALIGFYLARYFLREEIQRYYRRRLEPINEGIRHAGWLYLLVLRIAPLVPSPVVNFGMGLTHMHASVYATVTLLGRIPMTAIYVNLGMELSEITTLSDLLSMEIIGSLLLIALLVLGGHGVLQYGRSRRRAGKPLTPAGGA